MNYSIIIPHRNSPGELLQLIESIPVRDDLQVIVVDDNSDDDKKPIINLPMVNIILLDEKSSKGAGHARNVGMANAKGKWLLFADADDVYTDNLNFILDKYQDDVDTDLVYLNAEKVDDDGNRFPFVSSYYISNYKKKTFYSEKVLRFGFWTPWTRMVKKSLIDAYNICFDEIPTGNDMMFSLYCSMYATNIKAETPVVYLYYTPQNRSLTEASRKKITNIPYRIELGKRQNQLYKKVGFVFRDSNITAYRNPPAGSDRIAYQKEYKKQMRIHKVCLVGDLFHLIINRLGLMLGIIREGI